MQKWLSFFRRVIFLLLSAVLCCSCISQAVLPSDLNANKALEAINAAVSGAEMLSAAARIDLVTPAGHYPAKAALIIRKPSYLRLELLPPIGPPEFFLTTTPEEMKIILPAKGEFYRGKPTGYNLSRFLPWQFNIEDIVAIFSGGYPPLMDVATYQTRAEGNVLRIEMKARSGASQRLWVGPHYRLLRFVRCDENGNEIYSGKYEDYRESDQVARKITVSMADGVTSISINYSDLKIEAATDSSIFDLPLPAGFKTFFLD
jgi:hypothetical protein